jgi:VWFA-related protein
VPLTTGLAFLALSALPAQEPPRFSTRVEAVYVDAFVTEGGRPVRGLVASDFDLRADGVRQEVDLAAVESFPLSVLLVFDASGSVAGSRLAELRAAARAFLSGLSADDQCGLLTFNHELDLRLPLTLDRAAALRAIDGFLPMGSTALLDGVFAGLVLPGGSGRRLLLVFTDGRDNLSWLGARDVLAVAEQSNALVQFVGVSGEADGSVEAKRAADEPPYVRSLRQIAEATGGRFWAAASPERLKEAFLAVLEAMKTRYVLRFEPQGVARVGTHRLEVRLRRRRGEVHARRAYVVPREGS